MHSLPKTDVAHLLRYRVVKRYDPATLVELRALKSRVIDRYAGLSAGEPGVRRARQFAFAAVASYWDAMAAAAKFDVSLPQYSQPLRPAPRVMREDADSLGVLAAAVPQHEAMYVLGSVYAALLPVDVRSRNGIFFTPPPLVQRLCDLATEAGFNWEHGRVVDPACGGGAFLAPITSRLISVMTNAGLSARRMVDQIASRIRGIEIDPFSAWISQVLVEISAFDVCRRARARLPSLVTQANSLEISGTEWKQSFDLVIGNPPYGRVSLPPSLRTRYSSSLYGHANLYGIFTHLATRMVSGGGVIGFVTPTSFLGGQYFRNLRALLIAQAPPFAIDFIDDRTGVFDDVLQETCLATFQSRRRPSRVSIHFLKSTLDSPTYSVRNGGQYRCNGAAGSPWLLPRTSRHASLIQNVARMPWRLKNYGYSVSTGPLVWNRHKLQLTDQKTDRCYPLVWAESVRPDGVFEFRCERRNHRPFLKLRVGQQHLLSKEPCVLLQRTTAKEQLRRLIAAVMPSSFIVKYGGAIVENHLNMVRRRNSCDLVDADQQIALQAIAAVLNCQIVDDVFRCISGSVAVSAFELEELPLPDPGCMCDIEMLVDQGVSRDRIEERVRSAYGVS